MLQLDINKYIPENKRIGVVVSGGWDSAVLWYLVKNSCLQREQECVAYTVPKLDGAEHYANLVLKWYADKTKTEFIPTRIVGNLNSENTSDYVKSGVLEILDEKYSDFVFCGMNKYPPNQAEMCPHDKYLPNARYVPKESDYYWVAWPFADWYKTEVVKLAFDLGIAEEIMPITHTCTEQDRGRCGICWWCKEREWAFNELGLIDTGTE